MNVQYKTSSELKSQAKDLLDGRYGSAILILFVGYMIGILLSTAGSSVINMLQVSLHLSYMATIVAILLLNTVISLFTNVFSVGYALFFLNIACRRKCDVSNLYYGYRWQFNKCLTLSAFYAVATLIYTAPYQICYRLFLETKNTGWLMATMLTISAALIVGTIFTLLFSQCYYLMLDFPDHTVQQLIRGSIQIMNGHKGRLFYLQISFIPLALLAVLTCGIGMLWLAPYMNTTYACFYLDLMNPRREPEPQS